MLGGLAKRLFGSANDRFLKKLQPQVDAINAIEPDVAGLPDESSWSSHHASPRSRFANTWWPALPPNRPALISTARSDAGSEQ